MPDTGLFCLEQIHKFHPKATWQFGLVFLECLNRHKQKHFLTSVRHAVAAKLPVIASASTLKCCILSLVFIVTHYVLIPLGDFSWDSKICSKRYIHHRKQTCPLKRSHSKRKFHLPTAIFQGHVSFRGSRHWNPNKMFANTELEFQKDLKPNAIDLPLHMQLAMHCRQWHLEGPFFPWAKRRWTRQPCFETILRHHLFATQSTDPPIQDGIKAFINRGFWYQPSAS